MQTVSITVKEKAVFLPDSLPKEQEYHRDFAARTTDGRALTAEQKKAVRPFTDTPPQKKRFPFGNLFFFIFRKEEK